MKKWIFPGILALLFAAVLLAGFLPWDRILPAGEEAAADAETEAAPPAEQTLTYEGPSREWGILTADTWTVEGKVSYCRYRAGSENRWVIYLAGGGMSLDAHTAELPGVFYTTGTAWNGIWDGAFFSADETNPFRNWSYLLIPCDTADCYVGEGEFTGEEGTVLRHAGHENFMKYLDAFVFARSVPDSILLAGSSAGGFGAAMLAAEICSHFPLTEVTVLVDCSCLSADWKAIASEVWHAPEEIAARMETDDCVTDALVSLAGKYGDRVRILYLAAEGDRVLTAYQNYIDTGEFRPSPEAAEHYDRTLRAAVKRLSEEVPDAGVWILRASPSVSAVPHMLVPLLGEPLFGDGALTPLEWVRRTALREAEPDSFGLDGFPG